MVLPVSNQRVIITDGTTDTAVTTANQLHIFDATSGLAISQGLVTGNTFIHKFGNAPDFDAGDNQITVWDGAENGAAWELMNYVYSTTADIDSISSSSAADTQEINIQGLDSNYDIVTQTITLTGQTRAALSTNLIRVFRAYNDNGTETVGHVFIYVNGAITGGIPDTNADIRAIIDPDNQQTNMAMYTIPNGKTGYLRDWYAATAGANKNSNYVIKLKSRKTGKIFRVKHRSAISDTATSAYQHSYTEPEVFAARTDIEMTASVEAAGTTAASVSAGFDIVLVDD